MMTEGSAPRGARSTWAALLALVAAVIVVAALVALTAGNGDDDSSGAAGSTSTPTSSVPSTPGAPAQSSPDASPPPELSGQVEGAPASFVAVGLDDVVDDGDGVAAELSSISAIQASATGPGNIAGPALAVTVRVTNGTGEPLPLAEVEVALTYTAEEVAASPVDDDAASPLRGTLADGDSAEGTYVFSVPAGQRQVVTVTVGLRAGAPLLVFTGAVA